VDVLTTSVYGDLLVRGVVPLWFGCIVSQDMSDNAAIGAIIDSSADSCSSRIVLQKRDILFTIMTQVSGQNIYVQHNIKPVSLEGLHHVQLSAVLIAAAAALFCKKQTFCLL